MRPLRRRFLPAWIIVVLCGASMLVTGQAMLVSVRAVALPVSLKGVGDSDLVGELTGWQDTLFESAQPTDVQYFQVGSKEGRGQLLRGEADFAFGGVPFTPAELAARPAGSGEIISAPISVGSTAIVVSDAAQNGFTTQVIPCTPEEFAADPFQDACLPVPGPAPTRIRIPPENLAALITGLPTAVSSLTQWRDPQWSAAMETSSMIVQQNAQSHTFLNRAESASQNKYLLEYAQTLGPTAWALRKASNPEFSWDGGGEVFSPRVPSKSGLDTQLFFMSQPNDPISNGTLDGRWSGNMGPVPTTLVEKLKNDYPRPAYRLAEIQNANGDWVLPSKVSIDAALAAGLDPIIATKQKIPGAYPLVYINTISTIAGTLTPDKANSLASFIRYIVTDGQQAIIDHGSTGLPSTSRDLALVQADQIIVKNCTQAGYEVTTGGPGPFEPSTPGLQTVTAMKHCTAKPPPPPPTTSTTTVAESTTTTATTVPTTTSPTVQSQSIVIPPVSASSNTGSAQPVSSPIVATTVAPIEQTTTTIVAVSSTTVAAAQPASGAGIRPRGVSLRQLPLPTPPTGAEEVSRLGTLLLGAGLFLGARRRLLARRTP